MVKQTILWIFRVPGWMLWGQVLLVIDSRRQHLLGIRDNVRAVLQVEVLVRPHLAGGAAPRLHLVHDELDVVAAGIYHKKDLAPKHPARYSKDPKNSLRH